MTNKYLSRELCEICGIKPMYRLEDINALYNEDMYNEFCEMRLNKGLLIPTGTKAIFPDFTQPENFVKLLEIVSKKAGVTFWHNGSYFGCSIHYGFKDIFEADEGNIQHNFLNTLLIQDLRNPCRPKLLESIKQAIKSEVWKYD